MPEQVTWAEAVARYFGISLKEAATELQALDTSDAQDFANECARGIGAVTTQIDPRRQPAAGAEE